MKGDPEAQDKTMTKAQCHRLVKRIRRHNERPADDPSLSPEKHSVLLHPQRREIQESRDKEKGDEQGYTQVHDHHPGKIDQVYPLVFIQEKDDAKGTDGG